MFFFGKNTSGFKKMKQNRGRVETPNGAIHFLVSESMEEKSL